MHVDRERWEEEIDYGMLYVILSSSQASALAGWLIFLSRAVFH